MNSKLYTQLYSKHFAQNIFFFSFKFSCHFVPKNKMQKTILSIQTENIFCDKKIFSEKYII